MRDVIPYWKACVRCFYPLRVIRMKALQGPFSHDEFVAAASAARSESQAGDAVSERCVALWKMERIAFSYCRHGSGSLDRSSISAEILPIAHTGLGIAAVEEAGLVAAKLCESIDRRAHPEFAHFAYEAVGSAWGVCEKRGFRGLFETFTGVRFPKIALPNSSEFVAGFPAGSRPLLSHGYGRTLYFAHRNLAASLEAATAAEALDTEAAVQGVAFAYAMTNYADLLRILDSRPRFQSRAFAEAVTDGFVLALAMWTWTFPGFLDGLSPRSDRQAGLIDRAAQLVADSREAGRLTAPRLS